MGKQRESQQKVMAFVKVTQFLSANVERKQKLYQAHLTLIFRLVQSHSIFHWRNSAGRPLLQFPTFRNLRNITLYIQNPVR